MKALRLVSALAAFAWQSAAFAADAEPAASPRLAVVSDKDSRDLAAVVTVALSKEPGLALLERDDLAKAGDERRLQEMARGDGVALGSLLGADGLLFLSREAGGFQARFTAVGLGFVVFDIGFKPEATAEDIAGVLSPEIARLSPKLKLTPASAIPISILNLHADAPSKQGIDVERSLTLLLESRLAAVPALVVLERRRPGALSFERALSRNAPDLLEGAWLLDGALSLPAGEDGEVVAAIRLRQPGSDGRIDFSVKGALADLPRLADALAAGVAEAVHAKFSTAPSSQDEGREFLKEGLWAYQRGLFDPALEAVDSAELLGERAPDLLAIRIRALCTQQSGSGGPNRYDEMESPEGVDLSDAPERMTRALADLERYETGRMEDGLQLIDPRKSVDGRASTLHVIAVGTAGKVLGLLERAGDPRTADFRTTLRDYLKYDPLHGGIPDDALTAVEYADDLSVSMEEELALYRTLSTTYPWAAYEAWALGRTLSPETFCKRFLPDAAKRRDAYFAFLRSLLDDPVAKPAALLYLASRADPSGQAAACRALYDELWKERADLLRTKRLVYLLKYSMQLEQKRGVAVADARLIALLRYYLQNESDLVEVTVGVWCPELFPKDEATGLWRDLQGFEKRYLARKPGAGGYFPMMNQRFTDRFGNPDAAAAPPALVVNRFWYPAGATKMLVGNDKCISPTSDGVWFAGGYSGAAQRKAVLFHVRADTFQTEILENPIESQPEQVLATKDSLHVLHRSKEDPLRMKIARYDFASKAWQTHDVPLTERMYEVSGKLYLELHGADPKHRESGIARFDEKTGAVTLLASSRRKPGFNQFDDCDAYLMFGIVPGLGGQPWAILGIQTAAYVIREEPGEWPLASPCAVFARSFTDGSRTILFGSGESRNPRVDTVIELRRDATEPRLLLGSVRPMRPSASATPPPLPPWASRPPVWQPGAEADYRAGVYGFRGDDLFALVTEGRAVKNVELLWYRHGSREPVHIPLRFEMKEDAVSAVKAVLSPSVNTFDMIVHPNKMPVLLGMMTPSPQGLYFKAVQHGFWFLPYADIDAYLRDHGTAARVSAPPGPGLSPSGRSSAAGTSAAR